MARTTNLDEGDKVQIAYFKQDVLNGKSKAEAAKDSRKKTEAKGYRLVKDKSGQRHWVKGR